MLHVTTQRSDNNDLIITTLPSRPAPLYTVGSLHSMVGTDIYGHFLLAMKGSIIPCYLVYLL